MVSFTVPLHWFLRTIQKQTTVTRTNSLVLVADWVKEDEDGEETEAQHQRGQGKEKRWEKGKEKRWQKRG